MMMESWQKITIVYGARHFYAHSIDEDGNLKYDEKKDKRFHFANAGASDELIDDRSYDATTKELNRGTGLMRIQILHTRIEP
jgi:hypothetical protein